MAVLTAKPPPQAAPSGAGTPDTSHRWLPLTAAFGLIVAQLGIRAWVANSGYFYWDDLILAGRAGLFAPWSPQLLLHGHDGHFMPLAFLAAWLPTHAAPLAWAPVAASLVLSQLAVSLAVLRMLLVLTQPAGSSTALWREGWRSAPWMLLLPFAFYLFCPLTLPAFAWWSAALNALPLQFALAWVIGDALLLIRTGQRRYAYTGALVTVVALLFFEKAVVVPFVAFFVAAVALRLSGEQRPLRLAGRRAAPLWFASGAVLVCWLALYAAAVGFSGTPERPAGIGGILHRAIVSGLLPALAGGPWTWTRLQPSPPLATPPGWTVLLAAVAVTVVVAFTVWARKHSVLVWAGVLCYVVAVQLPVAVIRGGAQTAPELMQSLRYLADVTVVLAAAGSLLLRAPTRRPVRIRPAAVAGLAAVVAASSMWSTVTFTQSWAAGPQREYLANVRSALRDPTLRDAPLLEQEVPWEVLSPAARPQNLASQVTSAVAAAGTFATSTPRLRMISPAGRLAPAQVWWNRAIEPGPHPGCGYQLRDRGPAVLRLNGPMLERDWTAQLNYAANQAGWIFVGFEHGQPVRVPVRAGGHTVFVRLTGSGSALRLTPQTPGLTVCVGVGPVGVAAISG